MATKIHNVRVEVSGGVPDLAIQGFELNVAVNSIPTITVEALPISHSGTDIKASSAESGDPKMTFQNITKLYKDLSKKAMERSVKSTITIKHYTDTTSNSETLTLSNWILTDVGLSSVTNYTAPTLVLAFMHPIVELDHLGSIYELLNCSLEDKLEKMAGGSLKETMQNVLQTVSGDSLTFAKVASQSEGGVKGDMNGKISEIRTSLSSVQLGKYLTDTAGGFLSDSEIFPNIQKSIARLVFPQPFGDSIWMTLIRTACPSLFLQITPEYDKDQLKIEPLNPWGDDKFTLDSDLIESIDIASIDPDPIFGVGTSRPKNDSGFVQNGPIRSTDTSKELGLYLYLPNKVKEKTLSEVPGRILWYDCNRVLSRALDYGLPGKKQGGSNDIDDVETDNEPEVYPELMDKVAKATFNSNYRKHCKSEVVSVFSLKDKSGNTIYPGNVIIAQDKKNGKMAHGYLTHTKIKYSMSGGGATYFSLSYSRPEGGQESYVDEPDTNPCYS